MLFFCIYNYRGWTYWDWLASCRPPAPLCGVNKEKIVRWLCLSCAHIIKQVCFLNHFLIFATINNWAFYFTWLHYSCVDHSRVDRGLQYCGFNSPCWERGSCIRRVENLVLTYLRTLFPRTREPSSCTRRINNLVQVLEFLSKTRELYVLLLRVLKNLVPCTSGLPKRVCSTSGSTRVQPSTATSAPIKWAIPRVQELGS